MAEELHTCCSSIQISKSRPALHCWCSCNARWTCAPCAPKQCACSTKAFWLTGGAGWSTCGTASASSPSQAFPTRPVPTSCCQLASACMMVGGKGPGLAQEPKAGCSARTSCGSVDRQSHCCACPAAMKTQSLSIRLSAAGGPLQRSQ